MNYNNQFTSDIVADLQHYNMTDVYNTALNKSVLQNFLYFIILLIYLHYGTYNTPGHYLFLIISLLVLFLNFKRIRKNWVCYVTIIMIILVVTTYLFPYSNQSEITLHKIFTWIAGGMVAIHVLFFIGVGMALTPALYKQGKFVTTNLFF